MGGIRSIAGVRATAPLRVDCGNALDLQGLSVLLQPYDPCTLNIAIGPRVEVVVAPRDDGRVSVDDGAEAGEFSSYAEVPLGGSHRLAAAALHHYQLSGVSIQIRSVLPRGMGLGGSGAVSLCLVAACEAVTRADHDAGSGLPDLAACALLAQRLEAAVTPTAVGFQDHLAAAFGGASLWTWNSRDYAHPFRRLSLSDPDLLDELGRRLLVALTAEGHVDGGMTAEWVASVRQGVMPAWKATSATTRELAGCLERRDWSGAHDSLDRECQIRIRAWPETMTETARALREAALAGGGAARFAGGGRGGAVWALVPPESRDRVRTRWREILGQGGVEPLTASVEREGLVVEWAATSTSH